MEEVAQARLIKRILAHIIDFIIYQALCYGTQLAIEYVIPVNFYLSLLVDLLVTVLWAWIYYVRPHVQQGGSFGKKILGLSVIVEKTGKMMNMKQSWLRCAAYVLSYLPFGAGFLMALFNPQRKALHDYVVRTITIQKLA